MRKYTKLIIIIALVSVSGYLWMRRREKSKSSDVSGSSGTDSEGITKYPGNDDNNASQTGKVTDLTDNTLKDPFQTLTDNLTIEQ